MIFYRPTDGDVHSAPVPWRPRTAFLMVQLGRPLPPEVAGARQAIEAMLAARGLTLIDADSFTTGKDFLLKIWQLAIGVPIGIAIVHEGIPAPTLANIFYELGWLQAYGRETIVVRVGDVDIPSDFVRTEYVTFNAEFDRRFGAWLDSLEEQAGYYRRLADLVENNPLLAIDYLRRAFLLRADNECRDRAQEVFAAARFEGRARNSVETLAIEF